MKYKNTLILGTVIIIWIFFIALLIKSGFEPWDNADDRANFHVLNLLFGLFYSLVIIVKAIFSSSTKRTFFRKINWSQIVWSTLYWTFEFFYYYKNPLIAKEMKEDLKSGNIMLILYYSTAIISSVIIINKILKYKKLESSATVHNKAE